MNTKSVISFQKLTRPLLQTITVDNGEEISLFKELEAKTGLTVYFADPYATLQRGTYENTNGLLRFYFPKRSDFLAITKEDHDLII